MKSKVDKIDSHISNGYRDRESIKIGLKKLFKKEGIKDFESLKSIGLDDEERTYLEEIILYGAEPLPSRIPIKPNKKRAAQFKTFFDFWENRQQISKIILVVKGKSLTFSDPFIIEIFQMAFIELNSNLKKNDKDFSLREGGDSELYWTTIHSAMICFLYGLLEEMVREKSKYGNLFKSDRALNILTYKVLIALGLLPNKSESAMDAFIRKHLNAHSKHLK